MPIHFDDVQRDHLNTFRVYTPRFVWLLFVFTEFLTFYDRGAISGAIQQIRQDSDISGSKTEVLSSTKAGLLTSMFMAGFLIFAPIATGCGGMFSTRTILVVSLSLWLISVILSAVAPDYGTLLFARSLTGVGEAAFTPFCVTVIDNVAPRERRTVWIATFYAMIAVGMAAGMGGGGVMASDVQVSDTTPGWRFTFMLEASIGVFVLIVLAFLPQDYNVYDLEATVENAPEDVVEHQIAERAHDHGVDHGDYHVPILRAMKELVRIPEFMLLCFGNGFSYFATGALTSWMIQAVTQSVLDLDESKASLLIGGIMAFCGLVGCIVGGYVVDRFAPVTHPNCVVRSMYIAIIASCVAVPASGVALLAQKMWLYVLAFVPGVFCTMAMIPAVTVSLLGAVPSHLRPYSISFSFLIGHSMGDFPSPVVVGALSSAFAGECHDLNEVYCDWFNFGNATYDFNNNWLDGDCKWISSVHKGDNPYCANTMQLNKALLVALTVGAMMIPMWIAVVVRRRCCGSGSDDYDGTMNNKKTEQDPLLA